MGQSHWGDATFSLHIFQTIGLLTNECRGMLIAEVPSTIRELREFAGHAFELLWASRKVEKISPGTTTDE